MIERKQSMKEICKDTILKNKCRLNLLLEKNNQKQQGPKQSYKFLIEEFEQIKKLFNMSFLIEGAKMLEIFLRKDKNHYKNHQEKILWKAKAKRIIQSNKRSLGKLICLKLKNKMKF